MENKIGQSPSGISWKIIMKLTSISYDADGSWNIGIYPPEKQGSIPVPIGNTINVNNAHSDAK